jgi:hypothetical protein
MPGGRPTTEQRRKIAARRANVFELRLRNMSFRAIGEALHMHWRSVERDFEMVLQQVPVTDLRRHRRIELERSEAVAAPLWNILMGASVSPIRDDPRLSPILALSPPSSPSCPKDAVDPGG